MLQDGGQSLLDSLIASITAERSSVEAIQNEKDMKRCMERLNGVQCYDLFDHKIMSLTEK